MAAPVGSRGDLSARAAHALNMGGLWIGEHRSNIKQEEGLTILLGVSPAGASVGDKSVAWW